MDVIGNLRLSFAFELVAVYPEKVDLTGVTTDILDEVQRRLRERLGSALGDWPTQTFGIESVQRRNIAFIRITVASAPTAIGRAIGHLTSLLLASDRALCAHLAKANDLVAVTGPTHADVAAQRTLVVVGRDEPYLLEWVDVDGDSFRLMRLDDTEVPRPVDATLRRCIDAVRASGHGQDPLSRLVFDAEEISLQQRLRAGDRGALDDVALAERLAPATIEALLAAASHHGGETVGALVGSLITTILRPAEGYGILERVWREGDLDQRAAALVGLIKSVGFMRYGAAPSESGLAIRPVIKTEWADVAPLLLEAIESSGSLRRVACELAQRNKLPPPIVRLLVPIAAQRTDPAAAVIALRTLVVYDWPTFPGSELELLTEAIERMAGVIGPELHDRLETRIFLYRHHHGLR